MSTSSHATQSIQAYFSHSYRAEDRNVNLFFWQLFSERGFFFTVDPKSDRTFVPHLERMIRFSDCFVAIVTRRLETVKSIGSVILPQPQVVWTHSPYIEFENRLSVRSGKPRLIFVESGLDSNLFGPAEEVHVFDRDTLDRREEFYRTLVQEFVKTVLNYKQYADRLLQPTGKAAILIDTDKGGRVYTEETIDLIKGALKAGGYTASVISPRITDDQKFIRDLGDTELVISEIREPFVTPEALTFIHARFLPTIRICQCDSDREKQRPSLPGLLATGYTVGDINPIISWCTRDELVLETVLHMQKFQQTRVLLGTFDEGRGYFLSAGRREAKVFVSNAHTLNNLALELIKGFQTVNIQFFHYQATMRIGSAWQDELERELSECEVFIALISDEYDTSKWCQYELERAFERWKMKQVTILPYLITQTKLPDMIKDHIQCAFMHGMSPEMIVKTIVDTVDKHLTETEQTPPALRDRISDLTQALQLTVTRPTPQGFIQSVEEVIECLTGMLDIQHVPGSPPRIVEGVCCVDVRTENIFGKLPNFPEKVKFLFSRCLTTSRDDLGAIENLLREQSISVILMVTPISREDELERLKQMLDSHIREVYACDVVLLRHSDLISIVRDPVPSIAFKRIVLAQVDILNYAPFVITGSIPDRIFFGRESELRTICEHAQSTSYAVIGGRRIGKSSLLGHLHRVRLPSVGFRTTYHDCSTTLTGDEFGATVMRNWQPDAPVDTQVTFNDLMHISSVDKPLVLLLDEVDKIIPSDRENGWPIFNAMRAFANSRHAQFILSGERALRDALRDPKSPLFNFPNELFLGSLDIHAVEELITRPMKQLEIEIADEEVVVNRILAFTSGHPNVVQRLCRRLVERLNQQNVRLVKLSDVEAIIRDPDFQRKDFLGTYWEAATSLEKLISLLMSENATVHTMHAVRQALGERCNLHPKAREVDDALQRLVDLRSILKRTPTGYEFAVEAFPRVVAGTMTMNDMLEILVEEYQEQGE